MSLKARIPWLVPALAAAGLFLSAWTPQRKSPDLRAFAGLPVLHGGRVKPLDTVARTSLLMLRGRQTLEAGARRIGAAEWMLDAMARPETADSYPVFVVEDPDLRGLLGRGREGGKYFAFAELEPFLDEIGAHAAQSERLEAPQRSRFQAAAVHLQERLDLYQRLKNTLQVEGTQDMHGEVSAYLDAVSAGVRALKAQQASAPYDRRALEALAARFERYTFLSQAGYFRPIPPPEGESPEGFGSMGAGLLEAMRSGAPHPGVLAYARLAGAWRRGDAEAFDRALAEYRLWLDAHARGAMARAGYESLFNRVQPFTLGMILYVAVLLMAFASWLAWTEALQRSAYRLLLLAFGVHTAGLLSRVVLEGRPPVTNLYSSAVFVGWVAVLLGIVLERLYRRGFGAVAASAAGFSTLIVALHLTGQGDTMEVMRAVLDSNFWLATHVATITIGYGGTFLASLLAHIAIFRGLLAPGRDRDADRSLASMTYGVVCFSLFFSFLGTVLGGIWADQSWGRFWGWDPKENGALLIVLWNAVILHARWGGYIRERGLMLMAVFGGVLTSLSWFGVNMLGIGLHSYGFMDKAFYALSAFVAGELAVMGLGSVPPRHGAGSSQESVMRRCTHTAI